MNKLIEAHIKYGYQQSTTCDWILGYQKLPATDKPKFTVKRRVHKDGTDG